MTGLARQDDFVPNDVWNLGRPRTTALKNDLRILPEEFCEKTQQGWDLVKKGTGR